MLRLYKNLMGQTKPVLESLLKRRLRAGKEDEARLKERMGVSSRPRPEGHLFWVHAASIGEAQSALILVQRLLAANKPHILVTTGTRTSASLMEKNLPEGAFHQYYPLDHAEWVKNFLNHWRPDAALWMESELWPNMIVEIKSRKIPAALINARLSKKAYRRWKLFKKSIAEILSTFDLVLAQTERDKKYFTKLGAANVFVSDNLKYSASPLPYDDHDFDLLKKAIGNRPLWLYASTHAGEEKLAFDVHDTLAQKIPDLLTIIVPRHPERGHDIANLQEDYERDILLRREIKRLPDEDTDIYIANTLGELGLFYRLCPLAVIGRSFSDDGGGGHNPIEAAQLGCAVLHGPNVQNLQEIFDDMNADGAAVKIPDADSFAPLIEHYLTHAADLKTLQDKGKAFAARQVRVIDTVMDHLTPLISKIESA
jgi:3-deoxy-D-manno-octulosonic-acid transferase